MDYIKITLDYMRICKRLLTLAEISQITGQNLKIILHEAF